MRKVFFFRAVSHSNHVAVVHIKKNSIRHWRTFTNLIYGWNDNYSCTLTVQNSLIKFQWDSLLIFLNNSINFIRTWTSSYILKIFICSRIFQDTIHYFLFYYIVQKSPLQFIKTLKIYTIFLCIIEIFYM